MPESCQHIFRILKYTSLQEQRERERRRVEMELENTEYQMLIYENVLGTKAGPELNDSLLPQGLTHLCQQSTSLEVKILLPSGTNRSL